MSKTVNVTMGQIATRAGVSQATVSLVLNNVQTIKLAHSTREKVLRIAREMGYVQKNTIPPPRQEKIALIVNGLINHDPFIEAINAARHKAWEHNLLLTIFDHENESKHKIALENELRSGGYRGVIYASCMTGSIMSDFLKLSLPAVLLNGYCSDKPEVPSVLPADETGAYKATIHLLEQGFKQIAILTGELWMDATIARLQGYRKALKQYNIKPDDKYQQITNWSLAEAYKKTEYLLKTTPRPEAIFCCSDYIALGCYQAILARGLQIPRDIAVIGYDNQNISADLFPSLSTVELPYTQMGAMAVNILIKQINHPNSLPLKLRVEGELIVRNSSVKSKSEVSGTM
ncbi:bacterial regulatory s, lacI family protein [Escherichia coli 3-020-07_S1_C1]|uniref:LacI family DNA-binding transcriptional regulator n=4 Tax=Enterobacteriaceae TaxID=543 RepID=UPI0004D4D1C2|nr:LacI family DNA-binding transcriptional regulator [Escherichia coli]KDZ19203.1 bacterial regulatory s, lacI family protein [Escherichia coli 3-020-07_S1_C1]KDZ20191.1 bacterial regulatory s, lacI family protein [Escherichia coli 3-020-07_S1_C2]